jgi:hypothetical protein
VRRTRDPLEPPPTKEADPWLIPEFLWRKAQASALLDGAQLLAVTHDASDLGFNVRAQGGLEFATQGGLESLIGAMPSRPERFPVTPTPSRIRDWLWRQSYVQRRLDKVVAEIAGGPLADLEVTGSAFGRTPPPRPDPWAVLLDKLPPAHRPRLSYGLRRREPEAFLEAQQLVIRDEYESSGTLTSLFNVVGPVFDGKRQIQAITVELWVQVDTVFGLFGDARERRAHYNEAFERLYERSPRELKVLIEETNAGNFAMMLVGGGLANAFKSTGTRTGRSIGRLLEPFHGPSGFAREVGAATGARLGYEYTEGTYAPIRIVAAVAAGIVLASPEAFLNPTARAANASIRTVLDGRPPAVVVAGGADLPAVLPHSFPADAHARRVLGVRTVENVPPTTGQPGSGVRREMTEAVDRAFDLAGQSDTVPRSGVVHELEVAQALEETGAIVSRFDTIPGVGWVQAKFDPSIRLPRWFRQAYVAQGQAQARFSALIFSSRITLLKQLDEAFGGLDKVTRAPLRDPDLMVPTPVDLVPKFGPTMPISEHPLADRLIGVLDQPGHFDLTDYQRELIGKLDFRNSEVSWSAEREYGASIGEFGNVIRGTSAARRTRAHIPIVRRGAAPTNRLAQGMAGAGVSRQEAIAGRISARKAKNQSIWDVLADPLEGGDLHMVTDAKVLFTAMDNAKSMAVGRAVLNAGIGGQRVASPTHPRSLDLGGGEVRYFSQGEIDVLKPFIEADREAFFGFNFLEGFRQGRLGGDASPMTIHGSLAAFADMWGTARQLAEGFSLRHPFRAFSAEALAEDIATDPLGWAAFYSHMGLSPGAGTPEEFAAGWLRHIKWPGTRPSLASLNETTFTGLVRGMKRQFDEQSAFMVRNGVPLNDARVAAATNIRRIVPMSSARQLGLTPGRARLERVAATSVSFIRQPPVFVAAAARGYVKLGAQAGSGGHASWARLSTTEALAVQSFTKMAGSIMGLSVASAIWTHQERNLTLSEAIRQALSPGHSDFMKLHIGWPGHEYYFGVPLGGPYRSMIRAVVPQEGRNVIQQLLGFAESRVTPFAGLVFDFLRGKDFFGEDIGGTESWEAVVSSLAYAAEQTVPISVGAIGESVRRGEDFWDAVTNVTGEAFGQNFLPPSEREHLETVWRGGAFTLAAMSDDERLAAGMIPAQLEASVDFKTLTHLRRAIGTRAADALAESVTGGEGVADYHAELRRRADNGDYAAEALLVSVDAQLKLTALAEHLVITLDPPIEPELADILVLPPTIVADRPSYRASRRVNRIATRGELSAYSSVFDSYSKSDILIDKLTSEWYNLWELATVVVMVDGVKVRLDPDPAVFERLENQFYSSMGPEMAALVDANIHSPARGSNPLEDELIALESDLRGAGFWQVEHEMWLTFRTQIRTDDRRWFGQPEKTRRIIEQAQTYDEFIALLIPIAAQGFLDNREASNPREALALAQTHLDTDLGVHALQQGIRDMKAAWAFDHPDLAEQAIEWRILSPSRTNRQKIRDGRAAQAEGDTTPPPRSSSHNLQKTRDGRADQAEGDTTPPPRSSSQSSLENQMLAQLFLQGASYTAIADQTALKRGAVEQRLRRHFGGSPQQAREQFLANA